MTTLGFRPGYEFFTGVNDAAAKFAERRSLPLDTPSAQRDRAYAQKRCSLLRREKDGLCCLLISLHHHSTRVIRAKLTCATLFHGTNHVLDAARFRHRLLQVPPAAKPLIHFLNLICSFLAAWRGKPFRRRLFGGERGVTFSDLLLPFHHFGFDLSFAALGNVDVHGEAAVFLLLRNLRALEAAGLLDIRQQQHAL